MSTPSPENQRFIKNSQEESIAFIKGEIEQHIPQPKKGEPTILLDWWNNKVIVVRFPFLRTTTSWRHIKEK